MSVLEQVQSDVKDAMKAGERERVHALRLIVSELQKAAKENGADEVQVLQRERKRRLEAAVAYRDGGRTIPPTPRSARPRSSRRTCPPSSPTRSSTPSWGTPSPSRAPARRGEMGKVMGLVMPKVQGRADGKRVSAAVREKLTP